MTLGCAHSSNTSDSRSSNETCKVKRGEESETLFEGNEEDRRKALPRVQERRGRDRYFVTNFEVLLDPVNRCGNKGIMPIIGVKAVLPALKDGNVTTKPSGMTGTRG